MFWCVWVCWCGCAGLLACVGVGVDLWVCVGGCAGVCGGGWVGACGCVGCWSVSGLCCVFFVCVFPRSHLLTLSTVP